MKREDAISLLNTLADVGYGVSLTGADAPQGFQGDGTWRVSVGTFGLDDVDLRYLLDLMEIRKDLNLGIRFDTNGFLFLDVKRESAGAAGEKRKHPVTQEWSPKELSPAEIKVLTYWMETPDGSMNDIAEKLWLTRDTVRTHARSIYKKLGAKDRGQAVATAINLGLIRQRGA